MSRLLRTKTSASLQRVIEVALSFLPTMYMKVKLRLKGIRQAGKSEATRQLT